MGGAPGQLIFIGTFVGIFVGVLGGISVGDSVGAGMEVSVGSGRVTSAFAGAEGLLLSGSDMEGTVGILMGFGSLIAYTPPASERIKTQMMPSTTAVNGPTFFLEGSGVPTAGLPGSAPAACLLVDKPCASKPNTTVRSATMAGDIPAAAQAAINKAWVEA